MFLGFLTMLTALSISAVAIYYSVAGLVAIFASASVAIMIMGGILEVGKLVTAVWLHYYWNEARWWLKTYLSLAVVVLMFITSMGIFGFLSRAHIEQTATAQEGLAQLDRLDVEISRQNDIIKSAEISIVESQSRIGQANTEIQQQIDLEQSRIDNAYERIQPAIDEQNAIIEAAKSADAKRTEPYEQQLNALDQELKQIAIQADQYEQRIASLTIDNSSVSPIIAQITAIQDSISLVQSQISSNETSSIQRAQRTIGVEPDGRAGPNTQRAVESWMSQQQERIVVLQGQLAEAQQSASQSVDAERLRLISLVSSLRGEQTNLIKSRQQELISTIDSLRSAESPIINAAREEIQRIRASADAQIAQSNDLIQNLRNSLTIGKNEEIESFVADQNKKIIDANKTIDTLTEQKYQLQANYRKLEAEVGPVKYLAEFVYGEQADDKLLEQAVRWVIVIIIFVFDPLAVLLLIASQYTFDYQAKKRIAEKKEKENVDTLRYGNVGKNSETTSDPYLSHPGEKNPNQYHTNMDSRKNENAHNLSGTGLENRGLDETELFIAKEKTYDRTIQEDSVISNATVGDTSSEYSASTTATDVHGVEQDQIQVDDNRQEIDSKKKN